MACPSASVRMALQVCTYCSHVSSTELLVQIHVVLAEHNCGLARMRWQLLLCCCVDMCRLFFASLDTGSCRTVACSTEVFGIDPLCSNTDCVKCRHSVRAGSLLVRYYQPCCICYCCSYLCTDTQLLNRLLMRANLFHGCYVWSYR